MFNAFLKDLLTYLSIVNKNSVLCHQVSTQIIKIMIYKILVIKITLTTTFLTAGCWL